MMKLLKVFAVVFLAVMLTGSWASAQESDLPRCEGSYNGYTWNNCFGTYHWGGDKYVGEWRDGKWHGQGTFTYPDGHIEKGIWENGELVLSDD